MIMNTSQLSSLRKVRSLSDLEGGEVGRKIMLGGESFSYQIAVGMNTRRDIKIEIDSPIAEYVTLYAVKDAVLDLPSSPECPDTDFLTREIGVMPDILVPLEKQNNLISVNTSAAAVWVKIDLPRGMKAGNYDIIIRLKSVDVYKIHVQYEIEEKMEIEVLGLDIPEQKTIFTQWFHTDCIANVHNTEVYSERHWELIDAYMKMAKSLGINMILTPLLTPALDTERGGVRPCTQLVDIEKIGDKYVFDFARLLRWIALCKKNGIEYFEISHLFTQWGLENCPNIMVTENGEKTLMFGWHTSARDEEYKNFLTQLILAFVDIAKKENIFDKCFFHLSDEPTEAHLENYRYAHDLVRPLIGDRPIMDAISEISFYEHGLMTVPVTATDHIEPFLEKKIDTQWTYYCCCQENKVGNRFLSMPSYRNRILGLQLYKYDIKGFLHWGYNFYNAQLSRYPINPYVTTSASKGFPSGDSFSVYPGETEPYPSLRAVIFKEALQDIEICRLLESHIGREAVIELIDKEAGSELTFAEYPRNEAFIPNLMDRMLEMIKSYAK